MSPDAPPSLTVHPIGFIRSAHQVKFQAGHQPVETAPHQHSLELLPGKGYEEALRDLKGFSRIWLLWWFHRNPNWRASVLPPRGTQQRRGLFATRSPHRPNALGLTPVQLLKIRGLTLHLGPCDLVDGTPVFDIKPYIPAYDSFPDEEIGWLKEVEASSQTPASHSVAFDPLAAAQIDWLRERWAIDFRDRLIDLLSHDPRPHRTRRIRKRPAGGFEIACGAWRALFTTGVSSVQIHHVEPGYPLRFLVDPDRSPLPDRAAQIAFLEQWPEAGNRPGPPSNGTGAMPLP